MKVALVHDYIKEYGGAERVLEALTEIYPDAPIYTAFYQKGQAWEVFKNCDIRVSWAHYIPFFSTLFHSPLRFLAPLIWDSFDFSQYDVIISSASWFVTKGFGTRGTNRKKPIEICYCHTPPRYLYGYQTSINSNFLPVKIYAHLVNHFMRLYDFSASQKVNYFIANSYEVSKRIKKFYRRDSTVIYPPVELPQIKIQNSKIKNTNQSSKIDSYYLVVSRIVGGKGLELAVEAANKLKVPLKIVGSPAGYSNVYGKLYKKAGPTVEFLGFVSDEKLAQLYAGAKAFLALSQDEDFGITPVEAMSAGTPVIAYRSGGFQETVIDPSASSGQAATGIFFDELTVESLVKAIKSFDKLRINAEDCIRQAQKFSKERFKREIREFVSKITYGKKEKE
ncbi:MAG: glycosyltransferase [Candidatus Levybacteria bacterium]|nr:glycosyltransferase [Candidatus Levybacteria bacterium]